MSDLQNISHRSAGESFHIDTIVRKLHEARRTWRTSTQRVQEAGAREFPARAALEIVLNHLSGALFPMRLGPPDLRQESEDIYVAHALDVALNALLGQVYLELSLSTRKDREADFSRRHQHARELVGLFAQKLPEIRRLVDTDVLAAYRGDPAAGSVDEVLLCYPGVRAVLVHRIAHQLYQLSLPLISRMLAELSHEQTGIDIHPGARIGESFFIDHGTGVVIGETTVIGSRVRLYQAVTLGAKRFKAGAGGELVKGEPRHPRVEDDVVIYAGATVLGLITIGRGAVIGGNVWVTQDVPAGAHVTQAHVQQATKS